MAMKQLIDRLKRFIRQDKQSQLIKQRESKTKALIKDRLSDFDRWQKDEELLTNWNERTTILASYVLPNTNVIEFGAGKMYMKSILNNIASYTPSDIVKRDKTTIICDLNKPIDFDLSKYEVAIFSGVLEYVYDINSVVKELSKANVGQIIMSYCCSDIVSLTRTKNGWLSDYTRTELETIFMLNGYKIEHYREWRGQSIFNLIKWVDF
jgi:hypothetical protein